MLNETGEEVVYISNLSQNDITYANVANGTFKVHISTITLVTF